MPPQPAAGLRSRPLCVDLDGTLVRTDLLVESVFALVARHARYLLWLPLWLLKGKAYFKQQVAARIDLDVVSLPYHRSFLEYLRRERASGRRLILATSANAKLAAQVAAHLGLFDDVLASDAGTNLSGRRKLERLRAAYGERGFDYAGNARVDLVVWAHAGEAVLVNPARGIRAAAERRTKVARIFDDRERRLELFLEAIRLHQWLKNLLVFVPLVLAHRVQGPGLLLQALLAFFAFGLCAASVYVLNDLLDLPADRAHPTKRRRPFAAGAVSVVHGAALIPVLLAAAVGAALPLPREFLLLLMLYYASAAAYSVRLKRTLLIDVLVLAGLYTLRIMAGAAAVSVAVSFWLLAFSMFIFLSLALAKRYAELRMLHARGRGQAAGRGYRAVDLETLAQLGSSSGYMAVLVLALYINSEQVKPLYSHPQVLWMLCPLLLYLIGRIWLLARRNELHGDPLVFVIRDRRCQWLSVLGLVMLWAAV